jgi:hypothetical protein
METKLRIPGLPILQLSGPLGGQNNFAHFKASIAVYAVRNFGHLGKVIEQGTYYTAPLIPPLTEEEKAEDEANDDDLNRILRTERAKARVREQDAQAAQRPALYATIWGQLSSESEQKIQQIANWKQIHDEKDPLMLWQRIVATHASSESGNPAMDKQESRRRYAALRQRPDESTSDFKQRTDECLHIMEAVAQSVPPAEDIALDFLDRLDNSRFATLKTLLANSKVLGDDKYPKTLSEAYVLASSFKVMGRDGRAAAAAAEHFSDFPVFTAKVERFKKASGNLDSRGKPNSSGSGKTPDNPRGPRVAPDKSLPPPSPCKHCGGNHWNSDCSKAPKKSTRPSATKVHVANMDRKAKRATEEDEEEDPNGSILCFMADSHRSEQNSPRFEVLLDNQATGHIFRDKSLLRNLRKTDTFVTISGIGGSISTDLIGDFLNFGEVHYSPEACTNVLSFHKISKIAAITYNAPNDYFNVQFADREYKFHVKDGEGLYTCMFSPHTAYINTVSSNLAPYTKREVQLAKDARTIMERLGNPSKADMIAMIQGNSISNLPITSSDVTRCFDIFGQSLAALRGKTTIRPAVEVVADPPTAEGTKISLHVDIMFVEGDPYLITVSQPMSNVIVSWLGGKRTAAPVGRALASQINVYRARRFDVHTILTDGEGAIAKISPHFTKCGININTAGAGQHVPIVERKIRQLKERARGILGCLPYSLPRSLLQHLIGFCTSRLNLIPSRLHSTFQSASQWLKGTKPEFKRDVRISFGEYVHTTNTLNTNKSGTASRTEDCIALCPSGNIQGSARFYCLNTGGIITRDHWEPLPMPAWVIKRMDDLCRTETSPVSSNIGFARGYQNILDVSEPDISQESSPAPSEEHLHDIFTPIDFAGVEEEAVTQPSLQPPSVIHADGNFVPADLFQDLSPDSPTEAEQDPRGGVDYSVQEILTNVDLQGTQHHPASRDLFDQLEAPPEVPHPLPRIARYNYHEPPPAQVSQAVSEGRYNFRTNRHYGTREGGWRHREANSPEATGSNKVTSLHISIKRATKLYGILANDTLLKEVENLEAYSTFSPKFYSALSPAEKKGIIRSSAFIKEKFFPDGRFDKLKARIVAGGDGQDRSLYEDLYSPTISTEALFILASIAAKEARTVITADIGSAYLNAVMPSDTLVLARLEPAVAASFVQLYPTKYKPYLNSDGTIIVKLEKACYGCVESAKLWYANIVKTVTAHGFTHNPSQPCVFNKGIPGHQITIGIFVDDLFITVDQGVSPNSFLTHLTDTYGTVKVHTGKIHSFLGMTFDMSTPGECKISMAGYISDLLRLTGVTTKAASPAAGHLFHVQEDAPKLDTAGSKRFHSLVAKLLFLAKRVRPEILPAVIFLTTRVNGPDTDDDKKLTRILSYLHSQPSLFLRLTGSHVNSPACFVDASYAVHGDFKGHTGAFISLGGGAIHVKSSKQKINSKSSTEAELIALSDYSSQLIWTRDFLHHQGLSMNPALIYQDNKSTLALIERGRPSAELSRHINIRYFFVKDRIERGELQLEYKPTSEMAADILTKPLQGEHFRRLRDVLLHGEA